jgi:hypothetical protein
MIFRNLRIAWSLVCGITCVLLIVLWVRSNWRVDTLEFKDSRKLVAVGSIRGKVVLSRSFWLDSFGEEDISPEFGFTSSDFAWDEIFPQTMFSLVNGPWEGDCEVCFPHWSALSIVVVFSAVPWLSRLTRFTLRTLLIATMLVAVGLGLVVWLR